MANNFKSSWASNVGTSYATVYTVPTGKKSILIELDVANIAESDCLVSVGIADGAATTPSVFIIKNAPVYIGSSLPIISGQKLVLDASSTAKKILIISSVASSIDCIASVLEDIV